MRHRPISPFHFSIQHSEFSIQNFPHLASFRDAPLSSKKQNSVNLPENTRAVSKNSVNLPEKTLHFARRHRFSPMKSSELRTSSRPKKPFRILTPPSLQAGSDRHLDAARRLAIPWPGMEGPQTRALADHLNELLSGRPVEQIVVPQHRWQANVLLLNCVGQVVQRVRSHGKWLFFDFSHGMTWLCQLISRCKWTIQTESFVTDSTRLTAPQTSTRSKPNGQKKKRREPLLTLCLRGKGPSGQTVATLTGHPIFYIVATEKVRSHPDIKNLGPDPLTSAAFYDDFPYRLRQGPGRTVAAALLDQEVVAGLGNMLKCEILFAMRFAPTVRVGTLLASQIDHLAGTIVGLTATATTFAVKGEPFPYRVYDRAGLPCGVCNAEIAVDRSGQDAHLTWYCPTCQPLGQEPLLFDRT
jgi:formamidopyrimidine-DNA glycosylase